MSCSGKPETRYGPPSPTHMGNSYLLRRPLMHSLITRTVGLLVAATALGSAPLVAQATGTVRGTVTEADTKAPLPLAQVVVVGARLADVSGNDGAYTIRGVSPGTVTLRIVRLGFE